MNTPAVTVPPEVIPQSFVADDDANCPRGTTPDAGTGAPLPVVAAVPAPTNMVIAPALVITTDAGPGGDRSEHHRCPGNTHPQRVDHQVAPMADDRISDGAAVICQNVEAVPCAYVSGPFVNTEPALLPFTWAISCRGVPPSIAIHIPAVNDVPAALVRVVPPSAVAAVITVPCGEVV